jgi:hypothetical protein
MAKRSGLLPHGAVPTSAVTDTKTREVLMKIVENQQALAKEIEKMKRGGLK